MVSMVSLIVVYLLVQESSYFVKDYIKFIFGGFVND